MMVKFKKNSVFFSSAYNFLLGVFFIGLNFANNLHFAPVSSSISDAAPAISGGEEITTMHTALFSPAKLASNFSSTLTFSNTKNYIPSLSSYISIGGKTIATYNAINGTEDDAGNRVAKYNDTFYYGHNSSNVFGVLSSLPIGSIFSITEQGTTHTYKIASSELFEKTGDRTLSTKAHPERNFANAIYSASYLGKKYDIALMTCAGQMLGGGDATERYVVFAYEI